VAEVPENPNKDEEKGEALIVETFACVVCQETMLAPRVLCCGHMFCDDCISRWFRDKARTFLQCSPRTDARNRTPARRAESHAHPTPSPRAARRACRWRRRCAPSSRRTARSGYARRCGNETRW
jgi:hypothetical protein